MAVVVAVSVLVVALIRRHCSQVGETMTPDDDTCAFCILVRRLPVMAKMQGWAWARVFMLFQKMPPSWTSKAAQQLFRHG